jgi:lipoyl(octanoyl) transferase
VNYELAGARQDALPPGKDVVFDSKLAIHNSQFRFLDTPPAPGAWNMAVDAALMESVRAGAPPALRFYRWDPPCLSLGRNQPARGFYDLDAIRLRGLGLVRRPTGGRAVLHHRELTYSVVLPDGMLGGPRASYAVINRALAHGLRRLGVPAGLQARGAARAAVPSLAPCFREPAAGEVVLEGRKLVGSAQFREKGVVLQHGSLLLENDQSMAAALLLFPPPHEQDDDPPATLREVLDPLPAWHVLTGALAAGWQAVTGAEVQPASLVSEELERAAILREHFEDPAWTWRY